MGFVMGLQHQSIFPIAVMVLTFLCVALHYTSSKSRNPFLDKDSAYFPVQDGLLAPIDSSFGVTIV